MPTQNYSYSKFAYLNFNNQQQNQFAHNSKTLFPSQPINITPRENMPQQKVFANEQVFGKPKNVLKPTRQT